uniref:ubiquitinyl hydrolase 1 n=1 Tax=Hyaloperonospora arabidopsidis (strain Emoy2) TaxID=559515 RepID=M4C5Y2_HYAAE
MALCNVRHISLADSRQFETLCRVYKYCMEAINFYLNTCVFPNDTQQYPQRLSRTAWNLAARDSTIAFSGTNDNHRLLPLSVTQQEPNEPSLLGTNGKMIDKIIRVTHSYKVINPSLRRGLIPWQSVLLFAIDKKAQALIDTGALLAGVVNSDAAKCLLEQPDFAFAGVTFYDNRKEYSCWMIAEKTRQIVMPLERAPMLEKETFVIFDEARSRGSDRKLSHDASALITLGPKLAKDKLMQGAGRMRQLGCNQTLWIASFDEVAQSVLQTSGKPALSRVSVIDVLNWVMNNTKAEAVRGLLDWAGNGIHFRKTQLNQNKELVDENWSLETMYQEKLHVDKIAKIIDSKAHLDSKVSADAVVDKICCRGFVYGLDDEVCVTSHTTSANESSRLKKR